MQIPFDPDFDSSRKMNGLLNGLKPNAAFLFGVTVAIAAASILGLVALLLS